MSDNGNENPLQPPPWLNAPPVDPYPFEETFDLRHGPDLHPSLLGLLPYIGFWRGRGTGGYPTIEDFNYAQEMAAMGQPMSPHLSARLIRVGG